MLTEQNILQAIKFGIYAVLFLPLVVFPDLIIPLFFPFITSKAFLFQIIIEIIFALYLVLAIQNASFRPKKSLLFLAVGAYFGAIFLSTLFGVDVSRSFFGNYERMWGFFQLAHFFLFFIILAGVFKSRDEWNKLIRVALFFGALSMAVGLVQFFYPLVYGGGVSRASSITGNTSFFASYLFFPFLFSLFLYAHHFRASFRHSRPLRQSFSEASESGNPVNKKSLITSYTYLALSLLSLFAILSTATRGALVGLVAVAIVAALLVLLSFPRRALPKPCAKEGKRESSLKIISAVFLLFVIVGAIWLFSAGSLFEKPDGRIAQEKFFSLDRAGIPESAPSKFGSLKRLADFSFYNTTIQTRLITWKSSIRSFGDHPIFGVGPENFISAFNKHFNPEFYDYVKYDTWLDRAHNAFVDVLVMNGAVGFLAYLFLLLSCFYVAVRLYKKEKLRFHEMLVFVLFFVGYIAQNLFLFDTFSVFMMFILAVAFLNSFTGDSRRPDLPNIVRSAEVGSPKILASFLVIVTIIIYFFNIKPIKANYYLAEAESGDYGIDQAIEYYKKSESFNTFGSNEARSRMALAVAKEVQSAKGDTILPENLAGHLDLAIVALRKNIENSDTNNAIYRLQLADLYNLKLSRNKAATSEEIENIIQDAIEKNPGRIELLLARAQAELLKEDFGKSLELLETASRISPEHFMPYWKISQNYLLSGEIDKAIPFFEKALWLGAEPKNPKEILWAEKYYVGKEDYAKLIITDKILLGFYGDNKPEQIRIHINIAVAYAKLGQKDKAIEHANKITEIDLTQKEMVAAFLQAL